MKQLTLLLLLIPVISFAQTPTFQQEVGGNLDFHRNHINQLIDAIPDDKITWRSSDDVRSISEVVAHIAASTYNLSSALGKNIPEGVDPSGFEKSLTSKEDLKAAVNNAFDFAKEAIAGVSDEDLVTMVELPFGTFTKRNIMLIIVSHDTQHKGQFITYARSIGVTPPWNAEN